MNQRVVAKKKVPSMVWGLPLVAAVLGVGAYALLRSSTGTAASDYVFERARRGSLDVTVKKEGELQAVNNTDIICTVEGATAITSIVKEGSSVKKGDVLVQLDSSAIRQKIDDTTLDIQKAEADLTAAREFLEIQKSQNAANLEAAQVALDAAKIDLQKWVEGDYPQKLNDSQTAVQMAEIDVRNKEIDFGQVQDLATKGYLTQTDVELRRVDLVKSRNTLESARTTLKNLETYEQQKSLSTFKSALAQAEQKLYRTQRENAANLTQKTSDLEAKASTLDLMKRKLARFKEQYEACTLRAPEDGLVVYSSSVDRNQQTQIQEGATVRERQMILRLPDTSKMKAVIRIQEAQVTRLREGMRATVNVIGLSQTLSGTLTKISVLSDGGSRWWNPDLKEYPVDIELDETPPNLKPGIRAEAEILVARADDVVLVPVSALYASAGKNYVFVRSGREGELPRPREVTLGLASDTEAQVVSGVSANEPVLVLQAGQGRQLLLAAGLRDEPATRPAPGENPNGDRPGGDRPGRDRGTANRGSGDRADAARTAPTTRPLAGVPSTEAPRLGGKQAVTNVPAN